MLRSLILATTMAAAALALPGTAEAETNFYRIDFSADFDGDAVLRNVTGFYTYSQDTVTGFGDLVDIDVTINRTRFTMANSDGRHAPRGVFIPGPTSYAGGIVNPDLYTPEEDIRGLATGVDDFAISIWEDNPRTSLFIYTTADWAGAGVADQFNGMLRYTTTQVADPRAGAVPEPASWALMIGGIGLVGGTMRRRSTRVVFA